MPIVIRQYGLIGPRMEDEIWQANRNRDDESLYKADQCNMDYKNERLHSTSYLH